MAALLTAQRTDPAAGQRPLFALGGREPTLDELIVGVWDGLAADRSAPCPVCGETMRPVRMHEDGRGVALGRCDSCGTAIR